MLKSNVNSSKLVIGSNDVRRKCLTELGRKVRWR